MPPHIQISPVFSQLFMPSEVLGSRYFNIDSNEIPGSPLAIFNTSMRSALLHKPLLQAAQAQPSQSLGIWQLGKSRNHPSETVLHSFNEYLILLVAGWPHGDTIFHMRTNHWLVKAKQNILSLVDNSSINHSENSVGLVTSLNTLAGNL